MKPFLAPDRNNLSVAEVNEAWGERTKEINNKLVANLRNLYEKIGSTHRNIFIWDAIVALQMSHALEDAYQAERDALRSDLAEAVECLERWMACPMSITPKSNARALLARIKV